MIRTLLTWFQKSPPAEGQPDRARRMLRGVGMSLACETQSTSMMAGIYQGVRPRRGAAPLRVSVFSNAS